MKSKSRPSQLELYGGSSPLLLLTVWFDEAKNAETRDFDAAQLATVDERGMPNLRTVLVRERTEDGFVFYTNLQSKKGHELALLNKAALLFYWKSLARQIRIRGTATLVDNPKADAYFAKRPRESRIGAHASLQSCPLKTRADLEESFELLSHTYSGKEIPRPVNWSGFRIKPTEIEFWQEGPHRLHDRLLFERDPNGGRWRKTLLYP